MEEKVLEIVNQIRKNNNLDGLSNLNKTDNLRDDLGFTSFDLAELTVKIEDVYNIDIFEDGLVNTVGEIFQKLS
ncbi:MAG: phosphopantetheine-binding protein [Tissierellia bacterium]|nr:phosphopantetheine-binding protein [Tissierellia bacterium]MDD4781027.1 phosphopantetheine-binding protein [Tissierellia bacterium]